MSNDKTEINQNLTGNQNKVTEVNNSIGKGNGYTEVNPLISGGFIEIPNGTLLCGKYAVREPIRKNTGEASLYLCDYKGQQYVAKVYRRAVATKQEVLSALYSINSKYVSKLYEAGDYLGSPLEILPYYRYGSLEGRTFSYEDMEAVIIPELNEGLRALHEKNVIHKDLKPANIMMSDNQKDIAIIDFGISSIREKGISVVQTKTGMTPEYSAPETFRNLFLEESDYYSLGITLYTLFCGHTPFEGVSNEAIEQYVAIQKIPFPEDMPKQLKELITGLTYNDITNRRDKTNPNRRWTYDEVKKWCNGEDQPVPGQGEAIYDEEPMPPYSFNRHKFYSLRELANEMAIHWENGKKHLYRSSLSDFFNNVNPDFANACMDAEQEFANDKSKGNIEFFKIIYTMNPDMRNLFWIGTDYGPFTEYGRKIMLAAENHDINDELPELINNHVFSTYAECVSPDNKTAVRGIEAAEQLFISARDDDSRYLAATVIGRFMSRNYSFTINDVSFKTIGKFIEYLLELKNTNDSRYTALAGNVVLQKGKLSPSFESWLITQGKGNEVNRWKGYSKKNERS